MSAEKVVNILKNTQLQAAIKRAQEIASTAGPEVAPDPSLERQEREAQRAMAILGEGHRLLGARMEGPDTRPSKLLNWLKEDLKAPKQFYFLNGPPAAGKTYAMAAMAIRLDRPTLFFHSVKLATLLLGKDEGQLTRLENIPMLLIDDLGSEFDRDSFRGRDFIALLECLIDARYSRPGNITMMTTNLPKDAFAERYGGRVISRIEHSGRCLGTKEDHFRG